MKCDLCHRPAVIHEVTVRNGVKREQHLCEVHAAEAGLDVPGHEGSGLVTQFVICKGSTGTAATSRAHRTCSDCGLSFRQFRNKGLLGCPGCYDAFGDQLSTMIERAQNGGSGHVGKCPCRSGAGIDHQLQIKQLFKELSEAVAAEQYERAAELRDRLRDIAPGRVAAEPRAAGPDQAGPAIT